MPGVNVYLSEDELYELKTAAKGEGKSASQLAREILRGWIEDRRKAKRVMRVEQG